MKKRNPQKKARKCEVCGKLTTRKGKKALCNEHKEFESYSGFN